MDTHGHNTFFMKEWTVFPGIKGSKFHSWALSTSVFYNITKTWPWIKNEHVNNKDKWLPSAYTLTDKQTFRLYYVGAILGVYYIHTLISVSDCCFGLK